MKLKKTIVLIKERIKFCETVLSYNEISDKQRTEFNSALMSWKRFDSEIKDGNIKSLKTRFIRNVYNLIEFLQNQIQSIDPSGEIYELILDGHHPNKDDVIGYILYCCNKDIDELIDVMNEFNKFCKNN